MALTKEAQQAWLAQNVEEVIDPGREIIDPHHHMWRSSSLPVYLLEDLWSDTQSGHNIVKTVFMECGAEYRTEGPEHLKSLGETEFVRDAAIESRNVGKSEIAGIISHADLTMDLGLLRETLDGHEEVGQGLFRGIRHGGAHDPDKSLGWLDATPHPDLFTREDFRAGVRLLGDLGYTYDSWHYHFQNAAYTELAKSASDTTVVLDHFGSPCGVGSFEGKMQEVMEGWKLDITQMAECENVVVKVGGLAMPVNGFNWHKQEVPPSSDEVAQAHRDYYLHTIDAFGPSRCMFESNFPVDKLSMSYLVYWNAMKKIASEFSDDEQHQLFYGTAARVYRV